jgi:hypothetical protein
MDSSLAIMVPGVLYDLGKVVNTAVKGGLDGYYIERGRKIKLSDQIMASVLGIRFNTTDVRHEFRRKLGYRMRNLSDSNKELRGVLRGRSTVSEGEVRKAIADRDELSSEIILRLIRDYRAAVSFIGEDEAIMTMEEKNVPASIIDQVLDGYYESPGFSNIDWIEAEKEEMELNNPGRIKAMEDSLSDESIRIFSEDDIDRY